MRVFTRSNPSHQTQIPGQGYRGALRFNHGMTEFHYETDPLYFQKVAACLCDPEVQLEPEPEELELLRQAMDMILPTDFKNNVYLPPAAPAPDEDVPLAEDHDGLPTWPVVVPPPVEAAAVEEPGTLDNPRNGRRVKRPVIES